MWWMLSVDCRVSDYLLSTLQVGGELTEVVTPTKPSIAPTVVTLTLNIHVARDYYELGPKTLMRQTLTKNPIEKPSRKILWRNVDDPKSMTDVSKAYEQVTRYAKSCGDW